MAATTHVTRVFVQLLFGDVKQGAVTEVPGFDQGELVSSCVRHIFDFLSVELVNVGASQVKLYLSDETGVETSPSTRIGDALKPYKTLQEEVLARLNPISAEAGVPVPQLLFLLAVVESAWLGRGAGGWSTLVTGTYRHLTLLPLLFRGCSKCCRGRSRAVQRPPS